MDLFESSTLAQYRHMPNQRKNSATVPEIVRTAHGTLIQAGMLRGLTQPKSWGVTARTRSVARKKSFAACLLTSHSSRRLLTNPNDRIGLLPSHYCIQVILLGQHRWRWRTCLRGRWWRYQVLYRIPYFANSVSQSCPSLLGETDLSTPKSAFSHLER